MALLCAALAWRENAEKYAADEITNRHEYLQKQLNEIISNAKDGSKIQSSLKPDVSSLLPYAETPVLPPILADTLVNNTEIIAEPANLDRHVNNDTSNPPLKRGREENHPTNWMKKFKCDSDVIVIDDDEFLKKEDSFEDFQSINKAVEYVKQENASNSSGSNTPDNLKYQTFKKVPRIFVGSRT